jgi:subtilisin family serine protease
MKKWLIIIGFLSGLFISTSAQRLNYDKYWLNLVDKRGTLYNTDAPQEFLSERAIARRNNANIPVSEEDLPVSVVYLDSIRKTGVKVVGASKWFNSVIIQTTDSLALDKLSKFDFIIGFDTTYTNFSAARNEEFSCEESPSEIEKENFFYGVASRQISLLSGNFLHNFGFRGDGKKIAVLDAGFYKVDEIQAFQPVWRENRIVNYRDFVNPESDFFKQGTHGLAVLSTMAAYLPDTFVGTAPEASYLLLRSEDALSETKVEEAYWVLAAEYADSSGADIITSSLGYYDFPMIDAMDYSYEDLTGDRALVTRAAEKAFSKGMVVVASAGNEGNNFNWMKITPPADGPNVLAVGSIDTAYQVTSFSSRGNTTDGRIKPDVMAVGFRTKIINSLGEPAEGFGTSFAAPQIAGLIACLWQAAPDKTNREIIEAVKKSSNQYSSPDSISGYGVPNFVHALWLLKNVESESDQPGYIVFPNPFTEEFDIQSEFPNLITEKIDIYSSDGKLIYSNSKPWSPEKRLRISSLKKQAPGVYYIVGKTSEGEIVTKLIKQ